MDKLLKKLLSIISVFGVVLSVLVICVTILIVPSFNAVWLVGTCIYFLLLEICIIIYVGKVSKQQKRDKKLVNAYLLTKVVKILLSLVIIALYLLLVKAETKAYLTAFACLYFSYLIVESILFVKIEKYLKKETYEE